MGRSARKRRRVRISPLRPASSQTEAAAGGEARRLQPPGPGLKDVAAAAAQLAAELQGMCRQQQPGVACAEALASLLGLLAPLAPRETTALALSVLPAALQPRPGSRRLDLDGQGEQLSALLRLTLATLQAGLAEAAAGAVPASAALAALPAPHLLALLQRCWPAEAPLAAAGADVAAESRALALCAALAALQAELLDPVDFLELLQKELQQQDGSGGGGPTAAVAAAVLLPAACCIGASREHLLGSQPRATQGGRRQKHHHQPHPPSPLVAALQQLVGGVGQRPPERQQELLAAATRGLCCVLGHAHEPVQLALAAVEAAAVAGPGSGGAYGVVRVLQRGGRAAAVAAEGADFHPTLTASSSEWVRLVLEKLVAAEMPAEGQVGGAARLPRGMSQPGRAGWLGPRFAGLGCKLAVDNWSCNAVVAPSPQPG